MKIKGEELKSQILSTLKWRKLVNITSQDCLPGIQILIATNLLFILEKKKPTNKTKTRPDQCFNNNIFFLYYRVYNNLFQFYLPYIFPSDFCIACDSLQNALPQPRVWEKKKSLLLTKWKCTRRGERGEGGTLANRNCVFILILFYFYFIFFFNFC